MNYEHFSQGVSAAIAAKKAIEDFAATQADGMHFCPRCGRFTVKDRLHTNALSRHISVYICDACGMDEAIREYTEENLPLWDWAVAQLGAAMRYDEAYKREIRGEDCCPFWRQDEGGTCVACAGGSRACVSADGDVDCYVNGGWKKRGTASLTKDSEHIQVPGHYGTWYVVNESWFIRAEDQSRGKPKSVPAHLFLLKHETYGDEAGCVIADECGNLVLGDVHNGFKDLGEAGWMEVSKQEYRAAIAKAK